MFKRYWGRVHRAAKSGARQTLGLSGPAIMIAVFLGCIYLLLIWGALGETTATGELWLKLAASVAPLLALPLVYAVHFVCAPVRFDSELMERVEEFKAKLAPQINVFVEGNGAQVFALFNPHTGKPSGAYSRYVQFTVTPLADAPLKRCEARLTSVRRIVNGAESADLVEEHIWCGWSNHNGREIDIPPSIQHRINLFHLFQAAESKLEVDTDPLKVRLPNEIQTPGTYRICVSVTAQDAPTRQAVFLMQWGGKFNEISLKQES